MKESGHLKSSPFAVVDTNRHLLALTDDYKLELEKAYVGRTIDRVSESEIRHWITRMILETNVELKKVIQIAAFVDEQKTLISNTVFEMYKKINKPPFDYSH